jgi:hypothetical protein
MLVILLIMCHCLEVQPFLLEGAHCIVNAANISNHPVCSSQHMVHKWIRSLSSLVATKRGLPMYI